MGKLTEGLGSRKTGPFAGMVLGETRTWTRPNGETFTLTRTSREFIYDWVDASNNLIPRDRGLKWIVDRSGNAQLVSTRMADRENEPKINVSGRAA